MKKFIFSLQQVMQYREQTLDVLKGEMGRLQANLREIQNQIDALNREFRQLSRERAERSAAGVDPRTLLIYQNYLESLNRQGKALELKKSRLLQEIEKKKEEILQMNSSISGLKRLKEQQMKEYARQERREQEIFIEEFVGNTQTV